MIDTGLQEAAIAAVRAAAGVTRAVQAALITADTLHKKDKSPVTVADFASQAVICDALARATPDLPVVGEENADELRDDANATLRDAVARQVCTSRGHMSDQAVLACIDRGGFDPVKHRDVRRYWTLDPIDGTKGFLRREQYAIALALIEDGRVVLGVLGCPNMEAGGNSDPRPGSSSASPGVLMVAARGEGCRVLPLDDDRGAGAMGVVSDVDDPTAARFCESVESGHSNQDHSAQIARLLGIEAPPLRMDSQAKYAAVARGDASIYLRLPTRAGYEEKVWDHAAGVLAVEEAGGRVTDIAGKPLDFSRGRTLSANRGIIATNAKIHRAVVEAVGRVMNQ